MQQLAGQSVPYPLIAMGLKRGRVVPFFGAAASAVYRPERPWKPRESFMPFGSELATTLARLANYRSGDEAVAELKQGIEEVTWQCDPDRQQLLALLSQEVGATGEVDAAQQTQSRLALVLQNLIAGPPDLAFIASVVEHVQGNRDYINDILHDSFAVEAAPGLLHSAIAAVKATRLYVTTNYDDLLEQALAPRQPHLIVDRGGAQGLLVTPAGKDPVEVQPTGDGIYELLDDEESQRLCRPILFKMHGSVNKIDPKRDCYLITEEDYVDFLGRDKGHYVPLYVEAMMRNKDFLFLGYSLRDWNVRVILRKLLKGTATARRCWAIVSGKSQVEQQVWAKQNLNIHSENLKVFAEQLNTELASQ
jgi:hypothetical protein